MSRPKIVLAYSGGLDTSILVRILGDEYGYDVIACHADVGEAKDREKLAQKARQSGAVACEIVDAKDEFAREFCFPALQANALYQGVYPLSAALSRPLIARHLVAGHRRLGAFLVTHQHLDLRLEVLRVVLQRFFAAPVEKQIRLDLHCALLTGSA